MLAGLLFALRDADDRPDRLAATLPFGGVTLIEYQARLLVAAGASQIVVVVARLTPELLGALSRIGRRGVTVDAVRNAGEAVGKLHPLSRILVLADGLVTTEPVARALAGEGGDTLLVVGEDQAEPALERVGGRMAWAGVARLDPKRLREVAAMPRDWDIQSALLRAAAQAQAAHLLLPPGALAEGHGVEHRAAALDARGRAVLAAVVSDRAGWFERWLVAPIARLALPPLLRRHLPAAALAGAGAVLGAGGLAAVVLGHAAAGLAAALVGTVMLSLGVTLAELHDEARLARAVAAARMVVPMLAVLILGFCLPDGGPVLGISAALLAALGERAAAGRRRPEAWGDPAAYLLIAAIGTVFGFTPAGLALAGTYAAATLALAIERLRRNA
jgi:hypothetical protein